MCVWKVGREICVREKRTRQSMLLFDLILELCDMLLNFFKICF